MRTNVIYNEDCMVTMSEHIGCNAVDLILTSPPYNTSRKGNSLTQGCANIRYDSYNDLRDDDDYIQWTIDIFRNFDKVLVQNGCVLYNLSYSSDSKLPQYIRMRRNHPEIWEQLRLLSQRPNLCSYGFKYGKTLQEVEREMDALQCYQDCQLLLF